MVTRYAWKWNYSKGIWEASPLRSSLTPYSRTLIHIHIHVYFALCLFKFPTAFPCTAMKKYALWINSTETLFTWHAKAKANIAHETKQNVKVEREREKKEASGSIHTGHTTHGCTSCDNCFALSVNYYPEACGACMFVQIVIGYFLFAVCLCVYMCVSGVIHISLYLLSWLHPTWYYQGKSVCVCVCLVSFDKNVVRQQHIATDTQLLIILSQIVFRWPCVVYSVPIHLLAVATSQFPFQCAKTLIQQENYYFCDDFLPLINFNILWCCIICYERKHKMLLLSYIFEAHPPSKLASHFGSCARYFFGFDFVSSSFFFLVLLYLQKHSPQTFTVMPAINISAGSYIAKCIRNSDVRHSQCQAHTHTHTTTALIAGNFAVCCWITSHKMHFLSFIKLKRRAEERKDLKKLLNRQSA